MQEAQEAPPQAKSPAVSSDLRAQVLAELQSGAGADAVVEAAPAEGGGEPEAAEDAAPLEEGESDAADTEESPAPAPEEDADPGDESPAVPDKVETAAKEAPDKDLQKRLDVIQAAERRQKEAIAQERERFDARVREIQPKLDRLEQLERAAQRAKYDPASLLLELGIGEDALELAAKQVYARSKAAQADPRLREQAAREMREREYADELTSTRREMAEVKQQLAQQGYERQAHEYIQKVSRAASDETPIVKNWLDKNPARAEQKLIDVAMRLLDATGETPDPSDVVREVEKIRRKELEEDGVDLSAFISRTKSKPTPAGETKTAKTLSADLSKTTKPRSSTPKTRQELLDEVRRELEEGR